MTRKELFDRLRGALSALYPPTETESLALRLLDHFLSLGRTAIYLDPQAEAEASSALDAALAELLRGRPLQYVLGETEFCGLRLAVDESVLIPRPETEELVRRMLEELPDDRPLRILDIGTGSGAIAIALAWKFPQSKVFAVDVSSEALATARRNAGANGVKIQFSRCDILREKPGGRFDAIVSNPPYVRESERAAMHRNVVDHEPHAALFVPDNDPLLFYREIARWGRGTLNGGGALYFEINEAFGRQTAELLEALDEARTVKGKPVAILARTVKGKGLPFAEGQARFHNGSMTEAEYALALAAIEQMRKEA